MTYKKVRKFQKMLGKSENRQLENIVYNDSLPAFTNISATPKQENNESHEQLKQRVHELEEKLSKYKHLEDHTVKRLQRNVARLKEKMKRLG
ncbi:MAG: hypothetical protein ACOCZQ_02845 [Nanoarchaeota archaeon]